MHRQALVAHSCNPSYLGGCDWVDCSLRPAWAKRLQDTISINSWIWWYAPVSHTAKWEAEIGKITVPDQSGQKNL
jgi:hypothetical protein